MNEALIYYAVFAVLTAAAVVVKRPAAVQYVAAAFGIAGATLLAFPDAPSWGFGAFLVSNIGWITFSYQRKLWGQFAQTVCFLLTSILGLWNWWLGPWMLG